MYTCTDKMRMAWWKVRGYITRCTILKSDKKKVKGGMYTYLETISTKVSWTGEIFLGIL